MLATPTLKIRGTWSWILLFAFGLVAPRPVAADAPKKEKPTPEELAKAEAAVRGELAKVKGGNAKVQRLSSDALARTFPGQLFFSVLYPRYPVARVPPPPLKSSNIFVVRIAQKEKPLLVTDSKELEEWFKQALAPVERDDQAKDAVRAWLGLSQTFVQDGFYKFTLMDDSTKVRAIDSGREATGKVVVMAGGNGEINARMTFDKAGKLIKLDQDIAVKPGPRPKCQATKLLDTDRITREMAEEELLFMGRAAKDYLDEQRAQASPALQKAIDRIWKRIEAEGTERASR